MDRLASKKETARAQLASAEVQFEAAKDKNSVQAKRIGELQSELNSALSGQERLAKELEAAKSEVTVANTKADARVDQFKVDVEAIQAHAKSMDFDISAEIENAKAEEARARKLAFPEEGSESLSESEGGEDPEDEDAASDEDHAT
ncbi:uncharacterized protein [Nicotiana tomentosiformis]|uniref:uncharacterized protein n=1 Tax=Nicotiana tomentosiformis TaxID=4098 RepID=UPI00388CA61E